MDSRQPLGSTPLKTDRTRYPLLLTLGVTALSPALPIPAAPAGADSPCPWAGAPQEFSPAAYLPDAGRAELAGLVACLEHPDPRIRDGFAYETLARALREPMLSPDQARLLSKLLLDQLARAPGDPAGFRGPFAVLVLAEVARYDRLDAFLTEDELSELAAAGADYLDQLMDFRGFDPQAGWRHGVAHAADLFLQLALNPRLSPGDARKMLDAIATKVAPTGHAWVFGEPGRLARPVLYLALTNHFSDDDWRHWFRSLEPGSQDYWQAPYQSAEALATIHNLRAFALEIHLQATESGEPALRRLAPMTLRLLQALP